MSSQIIRTAHSSATEARQAVAEFHAAVVQQDMALVIFFCSSEYDLDVLAAEMNQRFSGVQVVGCTTAGEIGPAGYLQHTLTGASFPADSHLVVSGLLEDLSRFEISRAQVFVQTLLQRLESNDPKVCLENRFALLMIDGMSSREEPAAHALQYALGKIPLFVGSAGDDQKFVRTYVFSNGKFHADSAVLVLVNTAFPFMTFKTQHFIPTEERMVVTEADLSERIVKEINGLPAAEEYARMLGGRVDELNPMRFAASPVVVMIAGTNYVRSIQQANPDGSLTLYSAIEEGLVLRVAHGAGLVSNLEQTFDKIHAELGHPQLVIGCDCILRKLEVVQNGLQGRIAEIFKDNNTIGFNSYGEQFHGIHVNQTLTGVAIGSARTGTDV